MGPLQLKWIEALESGKYKQGRNFLRDGDKYCCLGVACEVLGLELRLHTNCNAYLLYNNSAYLIEYEKLGLLSVSGGLKVPHEGIQTLIGMNDAGWSFKEIAEYIKKHEDNVFEKSV